MGLSYTSIANAKANFEAEAAGLTFEKARKQAQETWQTELSKLAVEGNETGKVKFYTGLFHALLGRGIANDVNGSYPRHDGGIGQLPRDKKGRFSYNLQHRCHLGRLLEPDPVMGAVLSRALY